MLFLAEYASPEGHCLTAGASLYLQSLVCSHITGTRSRAGPGALQLLLRQWAGHGVSTTCVGWQERQRATLSPVFCVPTAPGIRVSRHCSLWSTLTMPAWAVPHPSPVSAWLFFCELMLSMSPLCCLSALQPPGTDSVSVPEDRPCFRCWPDPHCGRPSAHSWSLINSC